MNRIHIFYAVILFLVSCTATPTTPPPANTPTPTEAVTVKPTDSPTTTSPTVEPTATATTSPTAIPTNTPTPGSTDTPTPEPFTTTAVIGQSVNGTEITVTKLGSGETAVLLIGGLHAGFAPSTTTLAEQIIEHFSQNSQTLPTDVTLYVVTNANPDSLAGEMEALNGRLNGNEVDLNRNWDCNWNENAQWREQPVDGGEAPFSEPETNALHDLILEIEPTAVIVFEAVGGVVVPGVCDGNSVSQELAALYAQAANYRASGISTSSSVTGDLTDWLNSQNIPAIAPLLSDYTDTEWEQNLAGVEAAIAYGLNRKLVALCANVTEIPQIECEALITIYNQLDGPNWRNANGWIQTNTPCSWEGVKCANQHITELSLTSNRLNGNIPSEIDNLTEITVLDLNDNNLSSLPPEIGNLSRLTLLSLKGNSLTSLPPEIGNLSSLISLSLSANNLTTLPPEIAYLVPQFQQATEFPLDLSLALYGNEFTYLPPEFCEAVGDDLHFGDPIQSLCETRNSCDMVTEIPRDECDALASLYYNTGGEDMWIGRSTSAVFWFETDTPCTWDGITCEDGHVTKIDLSSPGVSVADTIPPEIGNLVYLTELHLSGDFSSIPPEIGNLHNLTDLQLMGNFTHLPAEIGNLSNLEILTLYPHLNELPSEIVNLTNLESLRLFSGMPNLVNTVNTLPSLKGLTLYGGDYLPSDIGKLAHIKRLHIGYTDIVSLPPEIGNLTQLESLILDDNLKLAYLPPEIGNLTNLTFFMIWWADIQHLPPEFGNLTNLTDLRLINSGSAIPPGLGNFTNLTHLEITDFGNSVLLSQDTCDQFPENIELIPETLCSP